MKIVEPKVIVQPYNAAQIKENIEIAGRTCYKSEDQITPESSNKMIKHLIERGHHSVLEHEKLTVRFICDRGVTHELVRHRLCAFSQESTRYCNYGKDKFGNEITVIKPFFFEGTNKKRYLQKRVWLTAMGFAEKLYLEMLEQGATPQEARSVLPNSLKTEIVTTANIREWRHIFTLRCAKVAHPQIQQIMIPLLQYLKVNGLGQLFADIPFNRDFPTEHYAEVSV